MSKLEDYLQNRCQNEHSTTFLTQELVGYLRANQDQVNQGQKWNTTVINAVVVFVGTETIKQILQAKLAPSPETVAHNACMDIYQVNYCDKKNLYFWQHDEIFYWYYLNPNNSG